MNKKIFLIFSFLMYEQLCVPPSLPNFGNTCYINATLQALYAIDFLTYFLSRQQTQLYQEGTLAHGYQHLVHLWQSNYPFKDYLQSFVNDSRSRMQELTGVGGCSQQDASEFMRQLILQLSEIPYIKDLFTLQFNVYRKKNNKVRSQKSEEATILNLDILDLETKQITSLNESLNQFFKEEEVEYESEMQKRQWVIKRSPKILCIALKRFDPLGQKIEKQITIPFHLSLDAFSLDRNENNKYNLKAVVIHRGTSVGGGHYITYVENVGQWYTCDDRKIQETTKEAIEIGTDHYPALNEGYIYIYQKKESPQEKKDREKGAELESSLQRLYSSLIELKNQIKSS